MEEEIYKEQEESEFNFGLSALQRIHETKKWLDFLTGSPDLEKYINHLKMYYKELHCMMNPTERELHEPKWKKCRDIKSKLSSKEVKPEDIFFLEEWELELRDVDQGKGMNIPKKTDGRFAIGNKR